jgi:hypothetical protein
MVITLIVRKALIALTTLIPLHLLLLKEKQEMTVEYFLELLRTKLIGKQERSKLGWLKELFI